MEVNGRDEIKVRGGKVDFEQEKDLSVMMNSPAV